MPEKKTIERAQKGRRQGKSPATQAGEFVREEIHHIREGKHGARSAKQAIAIGLSKARRAGVKLAPPEKGSVPEETRQAAKRDTAAGRKRPHAVSRARSRATTKALKREGRAAAGHTALARHAKASARQHTAKERSAAARKAARSKGPARRSAAARKAARTRQRTSR
jgi:uncharacterized protein DUF6496